MSIQPTPPPARAGTTETSDRVRLSDDLAFAVLYRRQADDQGIERLARACEHYVIEDPASLDVSGTFHDRVRVLSHEFGAFLVLELKSGDADRFVVRGPSGRLGPELASFRDKLKLVPGAPSEEASEVSRRPTWTVEIEKDSDPVGLCQHCPGATTVTLEIPPVFRQPDGSLFPVFFRAFRDALLAAVLRFTSEFLRLQTRSEIGSFEYMGPRDVAAPALEIDRQLGQIASSYRFLMLVAQANRREIRERFFDSNYEVVPAAHYPLLPVDPDLLKRRLFNLRIEDVDDPALSMIFREKREEIDEELTMLGERGTRRFFHLSVRRFHGVEPVVREAAHAILEHVPAETDGSGQPAAKAARRDAQHFAAQAAEEFAYLREQATDFQGQIHVREDVHVLTVSHGELFIPLASQFTDQQLASMVQHEVGTHMLTYFNGSQQPLKLMANGLADYDRLQEGLAVLAEYFCGALTPARLRALAGRVVAGECVMDGADFQETFRTLHRVHAFPAEEAFDTTIRMFQGGGFLKDTIYLDGLVGLRGYLMDGGELEPLLAGKFGLQHITTIKDLTRRGVLTPPRLRPRYLTFPGFAERMATVREGRALHELCSQ